MKETIIKGSAGVLATLGTLSVSRATVTSWLQIVSLSVGIAVGVATFISICKKKD